MIEQLLEFHIFTFIISVRIQNRILSHSAEVNKGRKILCLFPVKIETQFTAYRYKLQKTNTNCELKLIIAYQRVTVTKPAGLAFQILKFNSFILHTKNSKLQYS